MRLQRLGIEHMDIGNSHGVRRWRGPAWGLSLLTVVLLIVFVSIFSPENVLAQKQAGVDARPTERGVDLGAWGDDHVGKSIPSYMTGDECLFCHREVGETWQANRHNAGMRIADLVGPEVSALLGSAEAAAFGAETIYLLGGTQILRFLKPNGKYGQFAIHGTRAIPGESWTLEKGTGAWDEEAFAARCAGCHTTAVDMAIRGFAAPSLDCFVCHGDVPAGHQNEPSMALLAKSRGREPLVETSLCAQCHLRGGRSKSSGLPYPNQFVAGDNLFRDYVADLSEGAITGMTPADGHIFANVRDVVIGGKLELSCLSCHDAHKESTRKHRVLPKQERVEYCAICHQDPTDFEQIRTYERHSAVCEY